MIYKGTWVGNSVPRGIEQGHGLAWRIQEVWGLGRHRWIPLSDLVVSGPLTWSLQQKSQTQDSKNTCSQRQKVEDAIPSGLETGTASLILLLLVKAVKSLDQVHGERTQPHISMEEMSRICVQL